MDCYYTLKIGNDGWSAPEGSKLACFKQGTNTPLRSSENGATAPVSQEFATAPAAAGQSGNTRSRRRHGAGRD